MEERQDLAFISVAMDAQGSDAVRPFAAPFDAFPTLVDQENQLGEAFGYKAVPNGVLVNAEGDIHAVLPSGFDIRHSDTRELIDNWLAEDRSVDVDGDGGGDELPSEALALFRHAGEAYRNGDRETAIELLRQAFPLQPDNYIIRKQLWAIENPDKFYEGDIDYDWQREQLAKGR